MSILAARRTINWPRQFWLAEYSQLVGPGKGPLTWLSLSPYITLNSVIYHNSPWLPRHNDTLSLCNIPQISMVTNIGTWDIQLYRNSTVTRNWYTSHKIQPHRHMPISRNLIRCKKYSTTFSRPGLTWEPHCYRDRDQGTSCSHLALPQGLLLRHSKGQNTLRVDGLAPMGKDGKT